MPDKGGARFLASAKRICFAVLLRSASIEVAMVAAVKKLLLPFSSKRGVKTVVVLANDGMGDNLYRIPFFAALRERYPARSFRIVAFVLPGMVPMFSRMPFFDEVRRARLYDHRLLVWPFVDHVRWALFHHADAWINLVRIRTIGYDFAMRLADPEFSCAYDTALLSLHLPAEAAFQQTRMDGKYSQLLQSTVSKNHQEDYRTILRALYSGSDVPPLSDVNAGFLVEEDFDTGFLGTDYVVFVPGAASEYRRWPVDRFGEAARSLLSRSERLRVVVVGTEEEAALGEAVASVCPDRVANLCGKTTLPRLGKVLSRAKFVLSNETGTAHYAAALGVRTICILGGGDFGSYFPMPQRPHVTCLFRKEPCFGCSWICPRVNLRRSVAPCVAAIDVSDVMAVLSRNLTVSDNGNKELVHGS